MAKKTGTNSKVFEFEDLKKEIKKYSTLGGSLSTNDFATIKYYIHTGNYMLNALVSGSILKGYPAGRMIEIGGEKSTGKSYVMFNAIKHAQDAGMQVLFYDTETAVDKNVIAEAYDFDMDRIWYEPMNIIEEIKIHLVKTINILVKKKREGYEVPKLFIIIDSLGNLASQKEFDDSIKGEIKVDMTRAKALTSLFRLIAIPLNEIEATMVYTNHVYADTSSFIGGNIGKGGKGREYIASVLVQFFKSKGKDDGVTKNGIIVRAKTSEKNRFAIPHEMQFHIDFTKGMNPYIGLPFYGLPFKQDWFIDLEKEGWDILGMQYGRLINQSVFENLASKKGDKQPKAIETIQNTQFKSSEGVLYFVSDKNIRALDMGGLSNINIAVKHLGREVMLNEFYSKEVFTDEVLKTIDEKIIKPHISFGEHESIVDEISSVLYYKDNEKIDLDEEVDEYVDYIQADLEL